jgi:hypothetical protein
MKITETLKFFFDPFFLSKAFASKAALQKEQTLLPSSIHKKINLICDGKEKLKKECYHELEEIFLSDNL